MLAQAMRRTRATTVISSPPARTKRSRWLGLIADSVRGMRRTPRFEFASGYSFSRRAATVFIAASAWPRETAGLRRPRTAKRSARLSLNH